MYTSFWLAATSNHIWWMFLGEVGLVVSALLIVTRIIFFLLIDSQLPQDPPTYVPKRRRRHYDQLCTVIRHIIYDGFKAITHSIDNLKVRRRIRPSGMYYYRFRPRRKKYKVSMRAALTGMTTTWSTDNNASPGMFDSDSQALMLDDGASACITNDKNDFIAPPQRVDRKVKGIKGHARATHRGTIK